MLYCSFWYIYISYTLNIDGEKTHFCGIQCINNWNYHHITQTPLTITNKQKHVKQPPLPKLSIWYNACATCYLYWASHMILCFLCRFWILFAVFCTSIKYTFMYIIVINCYSSAKYLSGDVTHAYNESSSNRSTIITSRTTTTQLLSYHSKHQYQENILWYVQYMKSLLYQSVLIREGCAACK